MRQRRQRPPKWQRWLQEAIRSYEGRQYQSTIEQAQKALKAIRQEEKNGSLYEGLILFYIGRAQLDSQQFADAQQSLLDCQKMYDRFPPEDPMYSNNLALALADLYFETQNFAEAKPYYQQTLQKLEAEEDDDTSQQIKVVVYQRLAELSEHLREYDLAVEHYQAFLEVFGTIMGEDHPGFKRVQRHLQQLRVALDARAQNFPLEKIPISYSEEEQDHLSQAYARWLVSPYPAPSMASMTEILVKGEYLQLLRRTPEQWESICEISEGSLLGPLKASMRIIDGSMGHNLREGDICFQWRKADMSLVANLTYLGDGLLRWEDGWKGDAKLAWPEGFDEKLKELMG